MKQKRSRIIIEIDAGDVHSAVDLLTGPLRDLQLQISDQPESSISVRTLTYYLEKPEETPKK